MGKISDSLYQSKRLITELYGESRLREKIEEVILFGKDALDKTHMEIGKYLAETIMLVDREEIAGEDHHPKREGLYKWGSQEGSVFIAGQKLKVRCPRLRDNGKELVLPSHEKMKDPESFSDEMLSMALRGLSGRKYNETVVQISESFGVSPSSISKHLIDSTTRKLATFRERNLSHFKTFAVFIDTIHRGGQAFVTALGVNTYGQKLFLGIWEGATENGEVVKSLFQDLEKRGLKLHDEILFVTDGGSGLCGALRDRFGTRLLHQRCTIHKNRNIQRHLPKKYRDEAGRMFTDAISKDGYPEAKESLDRFREWLRGINESSARSLDEAFDEVLTLHRLGVNEILRRTLHSTNCIESVFSTVRHCEKNIKRYHGSFMSQRWLASVALYAEENLRTVSGYAHIPEVLERIRHMRNRQMQEA